MGDAIASDVGKTGIAGEAANGPARGKVGSSGNGEKSTNDTVATEFATVRAETIEIAEIVIPLQDATSVASVSKRNVSEGGKSATDSYLDAPSGPSSAAAYTTPVVAVSTVFKVPAKLLRGASACNPADVHDATPAEDRMITAMTDDAIIVSTAPPTVTEWGRHGYIIAEIYKIIGTMEPPWGSQCVFEAMARRFPKVEATALRMTVLAVLMTQRQCIRDVTLAGVRRGPRRDENGEVFIELDLVYANRYSDSYYNARRSKNVVIGLTRVNSRLLLAIC